MLTTLHWEMFVDIVDKMSVKLASKHMVNNPIPHKGHLAGAGGMEAKHMASVELIHSLCSLRTSSFEKVIVSLSLYVTLSEEPLKR